MRRELSPMEEAQQQIRQQLVRRLPGEFARRQPKKAAPSPELAITLVDAVCDILAQIDCRIVRNPVRCGRCQQVLDAENAPVLRHLASEELAYDLDVGMADQEERFRQFERTNARESKAIMAAAAARVGDATGRGVEL